MTLRITTGFLTGNIFEGQDFDTPVDERASADRYADLSHDAIKRAYPEATVEVNYQWAVGSIPHNLQTRVTEGDVDNLTDAELETIADDVDRITAEVWEDYHWVVEDETAPGECLYCGREVHIENAPAVDDDTAWTTIADEHASGCEWIVTRAHRIKV